VCVCIYIHICISFFRFEGDFSSSYIARPGNSKKKKKENRPAMTTCELRITHRVHPCI
jgi:hypothetical protein